MQKQKIYRDKETAVIAGVLAGLAEYFNQDPVLFRLAGIVFLIITGVFPGLIIYLIAWLMIPHKPTTHADYTINQS